MAKKKSSTKQEAPDFVALAKQRQQIRSLRCEGCFAPKNNLIVKSHIEKIWNHMEIGIKEDRLIVPCHYCKQRRDLPMSKVALNWFHQDLERGHKMFILLKDQADGKYNDLVGCDEVEDVGVDLEEWS